MRNSMPATLPSTAQACHRRPRNLDRVKASDHIALQHGFAEQLPELARKATAAPARAPRLVVLNEPLARELGLDPDWLRTDAGVLFLLGLELPEGAMPVAQLYS